VEGDVVLTRRQIERIALKNRVSLFVQERDYVQAAFLSLLYSRAAAFVLKGGTCLRIAYGSPRYSEDLDFNSQLGGDEAYRVLEVAAKELGYFGIGATVRDRRGSRSGFGVTLGYAGPLYDGRDITKGMIRIDVSLRGERVVEESVAVRTEYDDVRTFVVKISSLGDALAEKVRALLVRGMARDLYDIWFLLEKGVKPDLELINGKLALYNRRYSRKEVVERIAGLERSWVSDLRPLLGALVPYDVAARATIQGLRALTE